LFAYAVSDGGPALAEFAVRNFEPLHAALAVDKLAYPSWLKLRDVLPVLGREHDWDKCERLRRGIVTAFIVHDWPLDLFPRLATSTEVFRLLVESAGQVAGGAEMLKASADTWTSTPGEAADIRRGLLHDPRGNLSLNTELL
jgi:hypothetical protein